MTIAAARKRDQSKFEIMHLLSEQSCLDPREKRKTNTVAVELYFNSNQKMMVANAK